MLAENAFDAVLHLERVGSIRRISQIGRLTSAGGRLAGEALAAWQGNGSPAYSPLWAHFVAQWQE